MALKRDKYTCVFCPNKQLLSVHHIIDRKLFTDSGYYLDNGATVCEEHHWECEKTNISVEDVRKSCEINTIILPKNFDSSKKYDKWGNIILDNGRREPGEIFFEENVQKLSKINYIFLIFNYSFGLLDYVYDRTYSSLG